MKADERLAGIRAWDTLDERHRILIDVVKYYPVDLENWTDDILLLASDLVRAQSRIAALEPLIAHHQKHHDILCTLFGMAGKRMHERDDGQCLVEYWRRVTRIWEQKVTELERLVPDTIERCAQTAFDVGYRLSAQEEAGRDENIGIKITEAIAAAIRKCREGE